MTSARDTDVEQLLARLQPFQSRPRLFGLLLAGCAVLVAIGLWLLVHQNATIKQQYGMIKNQNIIIEKQKIELAKKNQQLREATGPLVLAVKDIPQDVVRASPAVAAAQSQALVVDKQIVADSPTVPVVAPPLTTSRAPVVLARGPTSGWDIDVFWCEGPAEDQDYAVARDSALKLANYAASKQALAPGIRLGRVRLRSWPETMRDGSFKGFSVVSDGTNGEDAVRSEIVKLLTASGNQQFQARRSVGKPTPYILSVFACKGWS